MFRDLRLARRSGPRRRRRPVAMVGSPRPLLRQDLRQNPILGQLLATSLFEDPAAGLHEHASARLREHRALLSCLILRRSWPLSSVGGHQDLAGGHEEYTVAITQIDRILGPLRCGVSCRPCAAAVRLGARVLASLWCTAAGGSDVPHVDL